MKFASFITKVHEFSQNSLGGLESQLRMAPKIRRNSIIEQLKSADPKKAAVLCLFYPDSNDNACVLLTKRASYNGTHSAQISFPGGKFEERDESLENTALREAHEEVGIQGGDVVVFKQISDVYIPPSNFMVSPFLGHISYKPQWRTNHEVASIVEISIEELLNDATISNTELTTSYAKKMKVPCFEFTNGMVWGATAMMLSEIKDLLNQ